MPDPTSVSTGPVAAVRARPVPAAAAVLVAAWAVTLWVDPWADEQVSDLGGRRYAARLFGSGLLPYRDVPFEYPPLMAGVLALTGILGTDQASYRLGIAAVCLGLGLAVLLLCARLAVLTGASAGAAALGVALAPLLLGSLVRTHLDLAAVALALAAVALAVEGRPASSGALVGLGAMTKAFPIVLAPLLLAWMVARGEARPAARAALALTATVALVGLGALALSPGGAARAVAYHLERPVQVESSPASVLLLLGPMTGEPARRVSSHGSEGLQHPLAGAAAGVGTAVLAAVVLGLGLALLRRPKPEDLVLASITALAACAAFGKVLSPQFLLWVVPLLAMAMAWRWWKLALTVAAAMALTLVEFPSRYFDLVAREPAAVAVVASRNALLMAAVALACRRLGRERERPLGYPKTRASIRSP